MNKLYDESLDIEKLKQIVNLFVDRMFNDVMIGFFFRKADKERIKEKEFEFLAEFLGFDIKYTGLSIPDAHEKHYIMGGQFSRRKQMLKEVLEESNVSDNVINIIMDHTEKFRMSIAKTKKSDCRPPQVTS
jgi:hemoglobin